MSTHTPSADRPTLDYAAAAGADPQHPASTPTAAKWIGRVLSVLVAGMLFMSAYMKFAKPPQAVEGFAHLGYSINVATALGVVELSCALLYLIPQTATLGAILIAAYLGGATASHVRIGETSEIIMPITLAVVAWLALLLRDRRLWSLLPIRRL